MSSCANLSSIASARLVARADRRLVGPHKAATRISHESIYRFIYDQIRRTNDGSWRHYLPRAKASAAGGRVPAAPPSASSRPCFHRFAASRGRPAYHLRPLGADLMLFTAPGHAILVSQERKSRAVLSAKQPGKRPSWLLHACSAGSPRSIRNCASPSPSTTAPSSPSISSWSISSTSKPSSAIPTAPGKRAPSKTPSAVCDASCPAAPTSAPSTTTPSTPASPPTTTRRENAFGSRPQPKYFLPNVALQM